MSTARISQNGSGAPARPPYLHRFIAGGHMRYWIIGSWALALLTNTPWPIVAVWYAATMASGLARTWVETRPTKADPSANGRAKLLIATLSCVAWAGAPLLSFFMGDRHGLTLAVALLCAGYTLVFTQMRAAPREALIVSSPYTVVVCILVWSLWGDPGALTVMAMAPVLGLALLIKVVITEMKDRQLEETNARQAELIVELEAARDQARAASDAKSNFLGVVSHELRTPMNGVLGAAQLLETTTDLCDKQQTYVSMIRRSGEGLLVMLNDILDLTKIEAGRMELTLEAAAMGDLRDRCIGPFQAQAEAKGLDFTLTVEGDTPGVVRTDMLRVGQIVQNLLSNAVKFTTAGTVGLTLRSTRLDETRARFEIAVSDTGSGIAEADLGQVFDAFTQADASSTRRFGGTGLGLNICHRLTTLLDGDIAVTSTLGQGSIFTLTLEIEVLSWDAARSEVAEGPADVEGEAAPLNVLVVEDHPVNRMLLHAWLDAGGHDCVMAENGAVAVELSQAQTFDLIIMDVNMPVMDGLAATQAIRAGDGLNRDTPIAVLSASARPEDHASGYAAGADAYVDKPVDFAALARVLATAPGGRTMVRSLLVLEAAA
jgi:signal transduction histidine kinase/CheY-like chemotaxis protein